MPPPCSLHPPHPTFSLPSHHVAPPPKQAIQITPTQPNPSSMRTAFNAQMVALREELPASDIALEWDQFMDERRRQKRCARRNKRKKNLGLWDGDGEEDIEDEIDEKWLFGPDKSRTLTKRQEAALSRYLKEQAMLESNSNQMTMKFTGYDSSYIETCISSKSRSYRDKVLLRARASEDRIITNYKGLVISIASSYAGSGISLDDLIQEGCVGLLRGVRKFDPSKGSKLSTYVYWWIKQAIVRTIANTSRLVRLPVNLCEATGKVMEAKSVLSKRLGRMPSYDEIAEVVNLSAKSVEIIIQRNRKPISLDQPVHQNGLQFKDIMSGPDELRPDLSVIRELKLQNLGKFLSKLSEKEEIVIRLRYGFGCKRAHTFEDIGKTIDVKGERARQIYVRAMRKLREEKGLIECLRQRTLS